MNIEELQKILKEIRETESAIIFLTCKQIGDAEAKLIAEVLKENKTLTNVFLNNNQIGAEGAKYITKALKENETLTNLDLYGNQIGDDGAIQIAYALEKNKTLKRLNLGDNNIQKAGANALAHALKFNNSITDLNLQDNKIGNAEAGVLAKSLKNNKTLKMLGLTRNQIGDEGAKAIARALKGNKTLASLNLSQNYIGNEGAESIARALKINNSIIKLSLDSNQIGDSGIIAIAEALKINNSVSNLSLSELDGDETKRLVINLLEYNFSLMDCYINFKNADLAQEKDNLLNRNKKVGGIIKSFKDFISNNSPYFSISKYLFLEKIISSLKEKEERNDYSPIWYKEFIKIRKKIKETWFSQLTYVSEQSLYDENSPFFMMQDIMPKIFKFFDLNEHRNILKTRQDSLHTKAEQEVSQINKNIPFYKTQDVMTNKFEHSYFSKIELSSFRTQEKQRALQREKEMDEGLSILRERTGASELSTMYQKILKDINR